MRIVKALFTTCWVLLSGALLYGQTNVSVSTAKVIDTFPHIETNVNSNNGGSATTMQGACFTLPCCSVVVYKVVLPANGALRMEMTNYVPLAGSMIAYRATTANPSSFSDLEYLSGLPGNFCGFRDTLELGRAFIWDGAPYGQVPPLTGLTAVYDFNNPSFQAGFMPAGDYYILVFTGNNQTNQGIGSSTDITFEFVEACSPLTAPTAVIFDDLEFNAESDTASFYVKNERDQAVTIDPNTGVNISGVDSAEFSMLTAPTSPIAINDSVLVEVVFTPTSGGAKSATLSIEFSDTSCSATNDISLSGSGAESDIVVLGNGISINNNDQTPSTSDYTDMGDVVTNTGSLTREFVITNTGTDTLELNGNPLVSISGSSQFAVTSLPSSSIVPGDSTSFAITFTPLVDSFDTIDISIASNDPDEDPFTYRARAQGAERNGLNLDGSNDYVNINAVADSMAGATTFTLEAWINVSTSQSGNDRLFGVNTSSNGTRFLVTFDDGILEFFDSSDEFRLAETNFKDGIWHHVALSFDNGLLLTWIDGTLTSVHNTGVPALAANDKWSIGQEFDSGSSPSDFLRGSINEVRIWKSARSGQDIVDDRYCELNMSTSHPNLVAYYTCNQGVAGGTNTSITTLTDVSGNSLHGTLQNFLRTGSTSNFISATEVGVSCNSFRVDLCDTDTYTSPSGKMYTSNGVYIDTIPNSMGSDSILHIDLSIGFSEYAQDALMDTTTCDTLLGNATTDLASFAAFNNSDDHWVQINDVAANISGTNRSVFTWMRQSTQVSSTAQILVAINTSGGSNVSLLQIGTNEQLGVNHGSSTVNSGTVVTDGIWHYVGYTYDENTDKTRVYVDGVEVDDFTNSQTVSATNQVSIGQEFDSGNSKGNFFQGEMTEVSIWSEVLDTADIRLAMEGAITSNHPKYSNLEGYYPMVVNCGSPTLVVNDYSGNNFHGIASSPAIQQTDSLVALPDFDGTEWFQKEWTRGAAVVSTADSLLLTPAIAGNYALRLYRDRFQVIDSFNVTLDAGCTTTIPVVASATVDSNVSCNGLADGGATISVSSGTAPYTYQWDNGDTSVSINGLAAGTYSVIVTDQANQKDTAFVTIGEPALLMVNVLADSNVSCNGLMDGGASAMVTGGNPPYNYAWSNTATTASITGLAAGTYSVFVTDNKGCSNASGITITEPTGPVAAFSLNPASGQAVPHAVFFTDQSTTPDTWNWMFGDGNSSTLQNPIHTYTSFGKFIVSLTVTDTITGCSSSATDSVLVCGVTAAAIADSNVSCNGLSDGGATASATGGSQPYSYLWSNGATAASISGVQAGTYGVTITDNLGCFDSANVTITEPALVIAAAIVDSNASCNGFMDGGATASATGGSQPYTYQWSNNATTASISGVSAGTYSVTITDFKGCFDSASVTVTEPALLIAASIVDSNASCNAFTDGGATASATGGTQPYTYQWSNNATTASISGVAAGTYSVTITDHKGCFDSSSVTVTEPALLIASSIVDSNASCNAFTDGGATAFATGGSQPYSYLWSNGANTASISGVAAGTYSVTITDFKGCFDSASATVTEPTALIAAAIVDSNETCAGFANGGATASGTGGTPSYSYLWSNGAMTASITGVAGGTYSVTVTDNKGCFDSASVSIGQQAAVTASAIVDSNVTCNSFTNGGATASGSGGTMSYTYLWSNNSTNASISGVAAGTYSVTVTDDNGCAGSSSVTITEPADIVAATVVDSNASCNAFTDGGATASATGGTPTYAYLWSTNATNASISGVAAGTYSVTITDTEGCFDSTTVTITEPVTLVAASIVDSNASCNTFTDGGATTSATGGTQPYTYLWSNGANTASISGVAAGTYSATITDSKGCFDSSSVTITEPAVLVASSVVDSNASCNTFTDGGVTASASGGTPIYAYAWSNGATSASISGVAAGTYSVTITDFKGCFDSTSATVTEPAVLIASVVVDSNETCTGNNDGGLTASATGGTATYSYLWSNGANAASATGLAAGTYTVTITDSKG